MATKFHFNWQSEKFKKWAAFSVVFAVSLLFFLFMTFPYEVFKETLSNNIKRQTGLDVSIGSMGMSLPIGLKLSDVAVLKPGVNRKVSLDAVRINIGVLPFLLGKLGLYVSIDQTNSKKEKGDLDVGLKASLVSLIFKGAFQISSFSLSAKQFDMEDIADLGLGILSSKRQLVSPLIVDVVKGIQLKGKLHGDIDLSMGGANPANASGVINLSLQKASLEMDEDVVPKQVFSKALLKADVKNGVITFDKNSGMVASDLAVDINGKLALKDNVLASMLDLKLEVRLSGELDENYSTLLMSFGGSNISVSLQGTLGQPLPQFGPATL